MIKDNFFGGWLIGGNFNKLLKSSKKKGGRSLNISRSSDMWEMINHCQLIDLSFKGSRYTWINKRYKKRHALIYERLDRFLANHEWVQQYPDA